MEQYFEILKNAQDAQMIGLKETKIFLFSFPNFTARIKKQILHNCTLLGALVFKQSNKSKI